MIPRIYIDTSIVGGYFDKEFATETKALFERLERKEVVFVASDLVFQELEQSPVHVRTLLKKYGEDYVKLIHLTKEAEDLAKQYIAEKVVGQASFDDCQHIAMATINKVDILASWNFKHIVNLTRIKGYNTVNMKLGYATIEIKTPKELMIWNK